MEPTSTRPPRPPWLSGLFSLVVPGLGQVLQGEVGRGVGLFFTALATALLIVWQGMLVLFVPFGLLWLWGVWDAFQRGRGRPTGSTSPFLLAALIVFALGARATEINPARLASNWPALRPVLSALVRPELLARPTEDLVASIPFQVPCVDPLPPPAGPSTVTPTLSTDVPCAAMGETIVLQGEGFFPNLEAEVWWQNPIGDYQRIVVGGEPLVVQTDAAGRLRAPVPVPTTAVPVDRLPGPGETQTHRIEVRQHRPYGSLQPTQTLKLVLEKAGETIALAFLATVLAVVFALPLGLLASRNLMWGNWFTRIVYYVVRTVLNVVRSIETLIWAIIFIVWVGPGAFDGTLAIFLHSIAALGKLYSEAIEAIDPGPIEAVRATGANWLQTVVYAVLPQFVPSFLSFTLYRWDINVRMSTVIGLVADAGLGFLIIQWIRLSRYNAMATSFIAIVSVVAVLDFVSAALRSRIIEGVPAQKRRGWLRKYVVPVALVAAFVAMFVWSWGVAEVDLEEFVAGAPEGLAMARDFLVPELITRPTEPMTVTAVLPVPCGVAEPVPQRSSGPRVNLSLPCGSPGDPLVISGHELPPDTRVSIRWTFADGGYLRVKEDCCDTDGQGNVRLETRIHPLMEIDPAKGQREPGNVQILWRKVVGGPQLSEAVRTVVDLSLVTLLMALMATVFGSVIAVPLGFLGASNIMGRRIVGRSVYHVARMVFNLWRSIEPMVLAVICAIWVGFGPFAGVLALGLWNIPNLAKLFSEAIEEVDQGPVEAVTATGANRLQTLIYAVVPQLVPRFLAYILYQWDINIRMSTIIGFVGGGGIGHEFRKWIQLNQYAAAGVATWAIVAMVWGMDYASAKVRERLA